MSESKPSDASNSEAVFRDVKYIVKSCFCSGTSIIQNKVPINTLLSLQKKIMLFGDRDDTLEYLKILIEYGIQNSNFFDKKSEEYDLSKKLLSIISMFVFCFALKHRDEYIEELLKGAVECLNGKSFKLPKTNENNIPITINRECELCFFIKLIMFLLLKHNFKKEIAIRVGYDCLKNKSKRIQYLGLKFFTRTWPYSANLAFQQTKILMDYLQTSIISLCEVYPKVDEIWTQAFKISVEHLPKQVKVLIGREFFDFISLITRIGQQKLTTEMIFNFVDQYLETNKYLYKQVSGVFQKYFYYFYESESFLNICKKIMYFDNNFAENIMKNYGDKDPKYINPLCTLDGVDHLDISKLIKYDPYYLYPIISHFNGNVPIILKNYLKEKIVEKIPNVEYVKPLLSFAANEILSQINKYKPYDVLKILEMIKERKKWIDIQEKHQTKIIKYSQTSDIIELSSFVALYSKQYDISQNIIKEKVNDINSFKCNYFVYLLPKICKENLENIIPKKLIFNLLELEMFECVQNIIEDKNYWEIFLKQFFDIFAESSDDLVVSNAFSFIKNNQKLQEIVELNRFYVAKRIFLMLLNNKETSIPIENRIMKYFILCQTQYFKKLFGLDKLKYSLLPILISEGNFNLLNVFSDMLNYINVSLIELLKNFIDNFLTKQFSFKPNIYDTLIEINDTISLIFNSTDGDISKISKILDEDFSGLLSNLNKDIFNFLKKANNEYSVLIDDCNNLLELLYSINEKIQKISIIIKNNISKLKTLTGIKSFKGISFIAFNQLVNTLNDETEFLKSDIIDLTNECKNDILTYLFGYLSKEGTSAGILMLNKINPSEQFYGSHLCRNSIGNITSEIMLLLGHPIKKVREQARNGIFILSEFYNKFVDYNKVEEKSIQNSIAYLLGKFFLSSILHFSLILGNKLVCQKLMVIKSLIFCIKSNYLENVLDNYYPKLISCIDIAIKYPELKSKCLKFWITYLKAIKTETLEHLFGHVVSQTIQLYNSFPKQSTKILEFLIIRNSQYTKKYFNEIINLEFFSEHHELENILKELKKFSNQNDWKEQIFDLFSKLDQASQQFRNILLRQIYMLLRQNVQDIEHDFTSKLFDSLWKLISHETNHQNLILCSRCMCILPFVKGVNYPEEETPDYDKTKLIIKKIVCDYLINILEDSTSISCYDKAGFTIQELLKILNCNEEDNYWDLFPISVQTVIEPFRNSTFRGKNIIISNGEYKEIVSSNKENSISVWLPAWTTALLNILSRDSSKVQNNSMFFCCMHILNYSPSFNKFILPYIIANNYDNKDFLHALKVEWSAIFKKLNSPSTESNLEVIFAKQAIILFFQLFDSLVKWEITPGTIRRRSKWKILRIANDDDFAIAAFECKLYHRALQHIEFYIYNNKIEDPTTNDKTSKLLYSIYSHLDHDSLEAFNGKNFSNNFEAEEIFSKREIELYDDFQAKDKISFIKQLLRSGCYERALSEALILKPKIETNPKLNFIILNSAIRLSKWDLLSKFTDDKLNETLDLSYQKKFDISLGKLLLCLHTESDILFEKQLEISRECLLPVLKSNSSISYDQMIPILALYHLLDEIEEIHKIKSLPKSWNQWSSQASLSIDVIEQITSIRCALIDIYSKENKDLLISEQWLSLAKLARKSNYLFRAEMFCSRAMQFAKDTKAQKSNCLFELSKILFSKPKNGLEALSLLQIEGSKQKEGSTLHSKILYLRAKWMIDLNDSDSAEIIKLLNQVIKNGNEQNIILGKAYFALANIADQRVISYIHYIEQIAADSSSVQIKYKTSSTKFWNSSTLPDSVTEFFKSQIPLAIKNYIATISLIPRYSYEVIPRILELFFDIGHKFTEDSSFDHINKKQKESVLSELKASMKIEDINKVSSTVWINSITQLISRIEQPPQLEGILYELLKICCRDFAYQSLWHLMTLRQSEFSTRKESFKAFWNSLTETDPKFENELNTIYNDYYPITSELIFLTKLQPPSSRSNLLDASVACPKIESCYGKNKKILMPLLSTLMFDIENRGKSDIFIESMSKNIVTLASLQKPKKIELVGSNGIKYHYLCKKDDDLRKDMRMMEFASFINRILRNDRRSKQRELSIVTYAVICLNERCGMIEWVENTTGFRSVIETIYNENHIKLEKVYVEKLRTDNPKKDPRINEMKQKVFKEKILPNLPPVLHIWFATNFKEISKWFQSRLLFCRSAAVWSMVGYIVGLGDRHAENILINKKTGGCVHVDFNCIFDKAKTLPVPECVPFRLTQNIVDGMGALGTNGNFSASCRLVIEILRTKRQKLISILQSLVHDPLLEWRKTNKETTVITAKMTIKEIERRLTGFSEDRSTILSPNSVVKELIKQARDPDNLALMFYGWQPYY